MTATALLCAWSILASPAHAAKKRSGKGTLVLVSTVEGAKVTINGLVAGETPLEPQRLRARTYKVKVEKLGHLAFERKVRVRPGKRVKVIADLMPVSGVLSVDVGLDGAVVFVDGKRAGLAPLEVEMSLGKRTVIVRHPGMLELMKQVQSVPGVVINLRGPMVADFDDDPLALAPLAPAVQPQADDPLALVPLGKDEAQDDPLALTPLAPPTVTTGRDGPDPALLTQEIPAAGSWYESWWAWGGAGVALAGSAVLTAVLLSGGEVPSGPVADTTVALEPNCTQWDDC